MVSNSRSTRFNLAKILVGCLLLSSCASANRGWLGFGQNQEVEQAEYDPREAHLQQQPLNPTQKLQVLKKLTTEKQKTSATALVQLSQPLDQLTATNLLASWKTMTAGANVQLETFQITPDQVVLRISNLNMWNQIKNMLLSDPNVAMVTLEQQVYSGSAALKQQFLEFEAERMEQQQELAEEAMERQMLTRGQNQFRGFSGFFGQNPDIQQNQQNQNSQGQQQPNAEL